MSLTHLTYLHVYVCFSIIIIIITGAAAVSIDNEFTGAFNMYIYIEVPYSSLVRARKVQEGRNIFLLYSV